MTLSESFLLYQSMISPDTIQAYKETECRGFTTSTLVLKISEINAELISLYKSIGCENCTFVKACEPFGELMSASRNLDLQKHIEEELKC
jgi:hypothetical protein